MSKYERYKQEIVEPRQKKREGKMLSSREMRRQIGRGNMKPKNIQQREIHNTMIQNKNLINSQKQQIILSEQKIQVLQTEMSAIIERLEILEMEKEPDDTGLRLKFEDETKGRSLWRGQETKAFKAWKSKQK